jgi:hypothetical protein
MFHTIKNYDEIQMNENSLIIMDIDNTIIKFEKLHKNWWKENEPNLLDILEEWLKIIKEEQPIMLDEIEFINLLNKINQTKSELIFVTAREENLSELTYNQLTNCGLSIEREQIYYSYPKGKKILEICQTKNQNQNKNKQNNQNIIFVDDQLYNIEDVQKYLIDYNVTYYLIEHKNLH